MVVSKELLVESLENELNKLLISDFKNPFVDLNFQLIMCTDDTLSNVEKYIEFLKLLRDKGLKELK
jgi:hypothetical protein